MLSSLVFSLFGFALADRSLQRSRPNEEEIEEERLANELAAAKIRVQSFYTEVTPTESDIEEVIVDEGLIPQSET